MRLYNRSHIALTTIVRNLNQLTSLTNPHHSGFDLRPFLYPSRFPWQFKKIDEIAAVLPDRSEQGVGVDKTKTE